MKHLFIINPVSSQVKGRVKELYAMIEEFFEKNLQLEYDIHVTRWSRDAVGYVRRYIENARQIIRVYALGGTGTLFEVINGVAGLPNVQVAFYPLGYSNSFVRFFGENKEYLFRSIKNLVFSDVIPLDLIRCKNNYGISFCSVGLESLIGKNIESLTGKTGFKAPVFNFIAPIYTVLSPFYLPLDYSVFLDDEEYSGKYASILIANSPYYSVGRASAIDASPSSGFLDVYFMRPFPVWQTPYVLRLYTTGNYRRLPSIITHKRVKTIRISSESIICINVDDEISYDTSVDFEVAQYAIDFVRPNGIEMSGGGTDA